jgi:hypothetical protein
MSFSIAFSFLLSHNSPIVAALPATLGPSLEHPFVGVLTPVHDALTPAVVPRPSPSRRPACPAHRGQARLPARVGSPRTRPSPRHDRAHPFSPVWPCPDHVEMDHSCPPAPPSLRGWANRAEHGHQEGRVVVANKRGEEEKHKASNGREWCQ